MNKFPCPSCNQSMFLANVNNQLWECWNCFIGYDILCGELYKIICDNHTKYISYPTIFKGSFQYYSRTFKLKAFR